MMEPRYMVAVQLNTLIAEGTATRKLIKEKTMLGVHRLTGDEQMMSPHQEPEHCDGNTRKCNKFVAEYRLSGETGDQLAHDAHARQNHDVDGRMRVEPEQVLKQNRIAAEGRIEDSGVQEALEAEQQDRDGEDRSTQHLNKAGGIVSPKRTAAIDPRSSPDARIL